MTAVLTVNLRLLGGASIFGLGWGIGGFCPGPAIAAIGLGTVIPAIAIYAGFLTALALEGTSRFVIHHLLFCIALLTLLGKLSAANFFTKNGNALWISLLAASIYFAPTLAT